MLMVRLLKKTFLFIFFSFQINIFAQHINTDTISDFVGPIEDTLYKTMGVSNLEEQIITLPISEDEIPSNMLYASWNNDHVRISRKNMTEFLVQPVTLKLIPPGKFVFPYNGQTISSFGYRGKSVHTGIDIKLNHGDSVRACFDGVIRMSKRYSSYGKIVVIRHYNGLETVYSHLSKLLVNVNQKVTAGDVIGLGGKTGRASTEHLHFETRYLEEPFNCLHIINIEKSDLQDSTITISKNTFKLRSKPIFRKGEPAEKYEDDNTLSDSLDILYANNWIWPASKAIKDSTQVDSLWSLPKENQIEKEKSKNINSEKHLKNSPNFIGPKEDTLFQTTTQNHISPKESAKNSSTKIHIVEAKETYYSISKKYKITVDKLLQQNHLTKDSILSIGQKLIIPNK